MKSRKAWLYGPFKSDFTPANPIHFQPPIEKPTLKITQNNNTQNNNTYNKMLLMN